MYLGTLALALAAVAVAVAVAAAMMGEAVGRAKAALRKLVAKLRIAEVEAEEAVGVTRSLSLPLDLAHVMTVMKINWVVAAAAKAAVIKVELAVAALSASEQLL